MPDIPALDVAVAFIFLFFILSLVCSSLNETVASLLRWRSKHLKLGIENLLSGKEDITDEGKAVAALLLRHPLIQTLAPPRSRLNKEPVPGYIPARAFVTALLTLDLALPEDKRPEQAKKTPTTRAEVERAIRNLQSKPVRDMLLMLFEAGGKDVAKFLDAGDKWFDASMDRVSGWYRRKTQWWLLLWAFLVALAVNADAIQIADRLWKDEAVRSAVVARADQAEQAGGEVDVEQTVSELEIPLGWNLSIGDDPRDVPNDAWAGLAKAVGVLITTFALLLGAPFWFDLLGKVARVRASGTVPPKAEGVVTAAGDVREAPPAGLKINDAPRRPVTDPTLGIPVDVDRTGTPRNRLVTIGDSVTHGFMSAAIFRTDLSWPAIVAYELGELATFRYPVYERPGGPGGVPLDIERALRSFESRFGSKLDWHEIVGALRWLHGYLDDIEDYWERGKGAKPPASKQILHNLAIYGWDLRDTLSLTATTVAKRIGRPRDDSWFPSQKVEDDNDRAALVVLESARGPGKSALTPLKAARALSEQGTRESRAGHGIETLAVILGSNNALQAVTKLKTLWSGDHYRDLSRKGDYTVWQPEHFAREWALVVAELRRIRARHVIVGTVPAVTIAPIAKGVGGKVRRGSRYFRYYTRPWISESDFEPDSDKHLTEAEARAVDSAIDAFNSTIIESVRAAREDGLDWYVFDLGGLLDRLAKKRYIADPAAQPAWWTPYPLPPELERLDPVPNTRFFLSGPNGRTDGGLFSLDGIHPTTIGYGVIAHEVMAIMNLAQVEFRKPTGEVRQPPVGVDFGRVLAADTLLGSPPTSLSSHLATLGWLDDKLDWVRSLA